VTWKRDDIPERLHFDNIYDSAIKERIIANSERWGL